MLNQPFANAEACLLYLCNRCEKLLLEKGSGDNDFRLLCRSTDHGDIEAEGTLTHVIKVALTPFLHEISKAADIVNKVTR